MKKKFIVFFITLCFGVNAIAIEDVQEFSSNSALKSKLNLYDKLFSKIIKSQEELKNKIAELEKISKKESNKVVTNSRYDEEFKNFLKDSKKK